MPDRRLAIPQRAHGGRPEDWQAQLRGHLDAAEIIILLISSTYLASDHGHAEAARALERHRTKEATIIPVLARPLDLPAAPLSGLQLLPRNASSVSLWPDPNLRREAGAACEQVDQTPEPRYGAVRWL